MKYESEELSNYSDFSNDSSQHSHVSTADLVITTCNSQHNGGSTYPFTFIALEGLNSGVPTRTTPTLTPTTLKNIEQTFIELQSESESHENEAGFVPPLVHSIGNNQYIPASEADIYSSKSNSSLWQSSLSQSSSDSNATSSRPTPPVTPNNLLTTTNNNNSNNNNNLSNMTTKTPTRRNMGGRKPAKDLNITPEEEERRRVRRERNKLAAARCRKRRVDHTNSLVQETDKLEEKKQDLQNQLQELHALKEDLEYILETHKSTGQCCLTSSHQLTSNKLRNNNNINNNNRPSTPPDIKPFVLPTYNNRKLLEERVKTEIIEPIASQQLTTTTTSGGSGGVLSSLNNVIHTTNGATTLNSRVHPRPVSATNPDEDDDLFSAPPLKKLMLNSEISITSSNNNNHNKPNRPNTLNVNNNNHGNIGSMKNISELAGITIQTPSSGLQFNFESLMVGGTGLTPVNAPLVPNCAQQQRIPSMSNVDMNLTSPDARSPPKLVSL